MKQESITAGAWGVGLTAITAVLIIVGSRNLAHFDAALVGYTFAVLFAVFGITYRYAMWLQRPPTRMYWRRGWQAFFSRRALAANTVSLGRRALVDLLMGDAGVTPTIERSIAPTSEVGIAPTRVTDWRVRSS